MPQFNLLLAAGAALIPLVLGFIWYNKFLFGKAWMASAGVTEEDGKKMNMPLVFGLTYVFSFLLAMALHSLTIHQFAFVSLVLLEMDITDPEELTAAVNSAAELTAHKYRTFRHGAVHGTIAGFIIALPLLGINALFEGKNWKYILINVGYWTVCMALMGGVICQWC